MQDELRKGYELVEFVQEEGNCQFRFDPSTQELWATTKAIADVFGVGTQAIVKHITNIYLSDELDKNRTSSILELVQKEGGRDVVREVTHYNIDVILAVGYRVNSKKATQFRQWANQILRAYIEQGYVINEAALRESPEKLNRLAAEIRALRAEEKSVYDKVRECFRISASDYEPSSKEVRHFYALLQDKFHHAITGMTSSKLIMDRADHNEENMGIQFMKGEFPTLREIKTGKNYLRAEELYRLHLLSEQFLLYAESTALAKKKMTMKSLHEQLDRLLRLNDYPVFEGYQDYLKDRAIAHAEREYALLKKRIYIQSQGIEYDEDLYQAGEYDEILADYTE